ncbi:MAG: DUF1651 domain-containing protein [Prochlorococcaceae cyanobacterium]
MIVQGQHLVARCQGWTRHNQVLAVISGELLPGEPVPLLKRRRELTREEAIRLWRQKREQGWEICPPQWAPPTSRSLG